MGNGMRLTQRIRIVLGYVGSVDVDPPKGVLETRDAPKMNLSPVSLIDNSTCRIPRAVCNVAWAPSPLVRGVPQTCKHVRAVEPVALALTT